MANPHITFSPAKLSWDENNNPYSNDYQDIYHAKNDALAESSYIFLEGNALELRWQALKDEKFIIGECGFGAGLNFLNTCRLWCKSVTSNSTLYYLAADLHPFKKEDLIKFYKNYPELNIYADDLLKLYPPLYPGIHTRNLYFGSKRVVLSLLFGDARELFSQIWQSKGFRVDAWYLDGFAPASNSNMWDENLCSVLSALSKNGTTLSTYSAAGLIKEALRKNNYKVERKKGFANKRHMLTAKYQHPTNEKTIENINKQKIDKQQIDKQQKAWFQLPAPEHNPDHKNKTAIIIGAGLAGCSTAYELARTGWQVTLIEREAKIANKASGNARGIVYCKLSNSSGPSADYYLHSYAYAIQHYQQLAEQHDIAWHPCGLLQIAYDEREQNRQKNVLKKQSADSFFAALDAQQASEAAAIKIERNALFFPDSGFVNPLSLCEAYTQNARISCLTDTEALTLHFGNGTWHVESSTGTSYQSSVVIIANSYDALNFEQSSHYPLVHNFGQIDEYPATVVSRDLSCVVCAKSYILPANAESQFIGGVSKAEEIMPNDMSNIAEENIELSKTISTQLAESFKKIQCISHRTGMRCSSPDYLPVVGPVENKNRCLEIYKTLRRNARKQLTDAPEYEPGLFINVGHGSHGLSSTPVSASYLAGLINNTPLHMTNANLNCLHPIRYLISDLKKQLV
jgi:tRNA 5-methylaminomethyl-2-thiouridine biosynthesis bifunctional protein